MPLSPTGAVPGTVKLNIRRRRAPVGEARSAVIALAGGPGQAAIPLTEDIRRNPRPDPLHPRPDRLRPARHRLLRPLSCAALADSAAPPRTGKLMRCAGADRPRPRPLHDPRHGRRHRSDPRSPAATKSSSSTAPPTARRSPSCYAQQHPEHVEALVLDSVVPPDGPEPLDRATFAAVPACCAQLCARHGCAHITRNPVPTCAACSRACAAPPCCGRMRRFAQATRTSSRQLTELLGDPDRGRSRPGTARRIPRRGARRRRRRLGSARTARRHGLRPRRRRTGHATPTCRSTSRRSAKRSPFRGAAAQARERAAPKRGPRSTRCPRAPPRAVRRARRAALSDMPACAEWPSQPRAAGGPAAHCRPCRR